MVKFTDLTAKNLMTNVNNYEFVFMYEACTDGYEILDGFERFTFRNSLGYYIILIEWNNGLNTIEVRKEMHHSDRETLSNYERIEEYHVYPNNCGFTFY